MANIAFKIVYLQHIHHKDIKNNNMLINFRFKNFLSYKDEASLLMTPVKSFKEHSDTHIITNKNQVNILKSAAIYGSNGGGKTNLINAIIYMMYCVNSSYSDSLKKQSERPNADYFFKLSTTTINTPTLFEVTIIENNIIYRYGFEIKEYEIISEWLYRKNEVETLLFNRNGQDFTINNKGLPEGKKYKDAVNSNVLFLTYLAQNNALEAKHVHHWFSDVNAISGLENTQFNKMTGTLLNHDENFKKWLELAIKFLDIKNVSTDKDGKEIFTYHNLYDDNHMIVDTVEFSLKRDESDGTCKLIYLLGAIYDTLKWGKVLFIDELDSKLHPNLSIKLLNFFHVLNKKKAQIIFTAHDAIMMDKEYFRRDQIWFIDRNSFGESELYSMSEFDTSVVKNTSDFKKKYLNSIFGAAESIDITNGLIDLIHG